MHRYRNRFDPGSRPGRDQSFQPLDGQKKFMRDQYSVAALGGLHPKVRKDFQDFIEECEEQFNITLRIVQGFRSFAEEDALYAKGRTVKGDNARPDHPMGDVVCNSKGGQSYHNYGLAIDIVPIDGKKEDWKFNYARIVNIGAQWNITWGGNFPGSFKDYDHFESKCGHSWQDLLPMYQAGKFIAGTKFVDF